MKFLKAVLERIPEPVHCRDLPWNEPMLPVPRMVREQLLNSVRASLLGAAYEYLIKYLADSAGKKAPVAIEKSLDNRKKFNYTNIS